MMSNLFSSFDTATSTILNLNWFSSMIFLIMTPYIYWFSFSRVSFLINKIQNHMFNEFKMIFVNKFNKLNSLFFFSLILFTFFNNFMGLFPYIFTSSSHLIFSLSISLPLWTGLMLMSWSKNYNHMFSHMIPANTPFMLMPFMVLIETISNIIRPATLSIRLTANMIAGHLLLTLLSQTICNSTLIVSILLILIQILLLILEYSVSIIQSYVFTILSSLYTKETNYV